MTSCTEVTVLAGFASLLLIIRVEDEDWGRGLNSEFIRDVRSDNWRDSTCEELLEDEDEDVGTAGAVVFVTICRLMCRG
jgi:hypothetical protein